MPLSRLSLTNFRSYADLVIHPGPAMVVLTGENGAGKTNILEAVSLLAPGRGLRGAALSEMARSDGPGGFAVAAHLLPLPFRGGDQGVGASVSEHSAQPNSSGLPHPNPSPEGEGLISLGTGTLASAPERRQVRINGAAAAANSLGEWLSVLWLTPAMDRLFTESAGGRRRFLDRLALALHPAHAMHAARYEAAMRARNKLLADEAPADPDWLTALEARMAEHGAAIEQARSATVDALSERLALAPPGPFARAAISLEAGGTGEVKPLAQALREGRTRDAAAGRTLTGPHRADLLVTHEGKGQPAARSSTGEQKALLLNLVLGHAELVRERSGRPLVLLLDEVAAHLDPSRRAALFERLAGTASQVWLTGTEPALFDAVGPDAAWFRVSPGAAERV